MLFRRDICACICDWSCLQTLPYNLKERIRKEMEGITLSSILTDIGSMFTSAIGWVGNVATTVAGQPLLLVWFLLPLIGLGVGLFKRLVSLH